MTKKFEDESAAPAVGRRDFLKLGAGAMMIGALKSAGHAAQAEPIRAVSIDTHCHWAPEAYTKALVELGGTPVGSPTPLNYDLNARCKWMDQHGVRMQVLTLNGGMPWQWVSPEGGAHLAQIVNDAAIEAHKAFPDRFLVGVAVPAHDPELSLKELNRVAGKPGVRAVQLPNSMAGKDYLFDPAYEPLLARCEELGYPLLFHPLDGEINYYAGARLGGKLADSAFLYNSLGFPFEHATTAAKFIVTGLLDTYPKLEIVLAHSGGCFPYIAGRVQHGFERKQFKLQRPFMEYVRRFHYDTLAFYPETLRFLITLVGSDRVVIGTDNYATMDVPEPNQLVEQLDLPAKDRNLILRDNAARLLRL